MSNPILKLLNVLPITTRVHTALEVALAETGHKKLRKIRTLNNVYEIIKEIIDNEGCGEVKSAQEDVLKSSVIYKEWQDSMPFLKDVPNIHNYRTKPKHKNNVVLINGEITKNGGLLSEGQILFRGGNFKKRNLLIKNGPISTTTMPAVARWHAIKAQGQIAILKITEDTKIKAFAFKIRGNQRLKHEYEILLQNDLSLRYIKSFSYGGMDILEYEVSLA